MLMISQFHELNAFFSWGMGSNGQLGQSDEEDLWEPGTMLGKQLEQRKVMAVSGGGQHTVLIAQGIFFVKLDELVSFFSVSYYYSQQLLDKSTVYWTWDL